MLMRIRTAGVLYRAAAVFYVIFLLVRPETAYEGAVKGLLLWYRSVLPVQFPFFTAVKLLWYSGCLDQLAKWLDPVMRKVFHLPGAAAAAIVSGWISGYPTGAQTALALYQEKRLSKEQYMHLLCFCNVPGPLFVIATVGGRFLGDVKAGYLLMLAQLLAVILCGILLRSPGMPVIEKSRCNRRDRLPLGTMLRNAVDESVGTVVMVGGFIVIFSVLLAWMPDIIGIAALEMTNGCEMLAEYKSRWAIAAIGFLLGWGGVCVLLQTVAVVRDGPLLSVRYWMSRVLQGILAGGISWFFFGNMNV